MTKMTPQLVLLMIRQEMERLDLIHHPIPTLDEVGYPDAVQYAIGRRGGSLYGLGKAEQLIKDNLVPEWINEPCHAKDGSGAWYWIRGKNEPCRIRYAENLEIWLYENDHWEWPYLSRLDGAQVAPVTNAGRPSDPDRQLEPKGNSQ